MQTKAQKWGNSLAVRVPKAIAERAGVGANDSLDIEVTDNHIVLTPHRPRRYRLQDMVKRITKENMHEEIDLGPPVGREVW
jgi:antitoxin MazE